MDNFLEAVRLLILPVLFAVIALLITGWLTGGLRLALPRSPVALVWGLVAGILWGLFQQYLVQGFVNRRAQLVWGRGALSIVATGLVFALVHLPNPWLTLITFIGGSASAAVYQRAPNLPALALAHAVVTWTLISTVPQSALGGLRVGFIYFA